MAERSDSKTASRAIAAFAAALTYDDIPSATIATVKRIVLDCIGAALAATTLGEGCRESVAVASRLGGRPESTILGFGTKVPSPQAAFANGALVHALNYDPIGSDIGHIGVVCLAAPLAMAEAIGGVSGRDFIAAATVACEVSARVTAAISRTGRRPSEKFLSGQLLSHFGAAAGAGRICGFGAGEMESVLGLALMQMSGSRQIVLSGDPPAKAIYGAFPNQAAVLSALLVREGLGARCDVFGEPAGLYAAIYGGEHDKSALTEGLGDVFLLDEVEFKPWPTSNQVHPFIEAAIEIGAGGIKFSDIADIEVTCHSRLDPWWEPAERRRRPENAAVAADSIPFCVAAALVRGDVGLSTFTAEGLNDSAIVLLASRISHRIDDSTKGTVVTVTSRTGQRISASVDMPLGSRSRPISDERLVQKFRDCCSRAVTRLTPDQIERLIGMVFELERMDGVEPLVALAIGRELGAR